MSVQPGPTFKRYAANGVATVYAIPFLLLDAADLQITLNGTLVTTGFTLSGINSPTSTCTFAAAPTGDLLFQMVMTFQRLADYQMNGDFLSGTVNRDYDRLWLAIKQVSRDSGRALTVSPLEPEGIPVLPIKAARSLRMLAFDVDGNPITSNLTLAQLEQQPALATSAASAAAASATASASSATSSGASATASAASATLAMKWAENPEDTPVLPGLFSAHHWANKAAAVAATISGLFTRMTAVEQRATDLEYSYISPNTAFTNGGSITLSHGLGVRPQRISWEAICTTADASYSIGTVLYLGEGLNWAITGTAFGFTVEATSTQIICNIANGGIPVVNKSTRLTSALIPGSWMLRAKASKS